MGIWSRLSKLAFLPVVVYSAALSRHALKGHFSGDDPMNLVYAWRRGFWYLIWHSITFWTTTYRPAGSLYYLSIYSLFGLNPFPYRVASLCLLAANAYLSYRVAERLTDSRTIAFLAGVFAAAHGLMVTLYYQNAFIYDVLVYLFSILTLNYYVKLRKAGIVPNLRQSLGIAALYIAALNSKEIGVTVAGFILMYELLFHGGPRLTRQGVIAWVKREGRLPMIFGVLAVIYTVGKIVGPESLSKIAGYKIEISAAKYLASRVHHWNDLFYMFPMISPRVMVGVDVVLLLVLLFYRKSPALQWACFYVLTAALPVTFIQERGESELYLALFGWALLAAIVLVKLIETLSPTIVWTRFKIPAAAISVVLVCGLTYEYVSETVFEWRYRTRANLEDQAPTWAALSKLKQLPFRPAPGTRVLFLKDPFPEDYKTESIGELIWNDHSVVVDLASHHSDYTPEVIQGFDVLLTFEDGQFKVVRSSLAAKTE